MIEPSPAERLAALHLLRRVQVADLARTDRWIAQAEQRVAEVAKPRPAPKPTPLPRPPYVTQTRHGRPPILHGPDCWVRDDGLGTLAVEADEAREGLDAGAVEACDVCRPEVGLGVA